MFLLWGASAIAIAASQVRNRASAPACGNSAFNPVVILHGLGANKNEDLNFLETFLQQQGFCTFSLTYGEYPLLPVVGGLEPIATSAAEIGSFIKQTIASSGARQVDIVGHSEGAFQALYVPKFQNVAPLVNKIVAIAPPTHGTNFAGLYNLAYVFGNQSRTLVGDVLDLLGCAACNDLGPGGAAVTRLNDGKPIVQPGNTLTVIASKSDELVTPTDTAFVNEPGVHNIYVQDYCPLDPVGHIGEAYDLNVWNLVLNALTAAPDRQFDCVIGAPG
jgi:triacylglycerol esterase/lipase EstA (alpha/beta hydrolase family)